MTDEAKLKILIEAQNKAKAAFDEANSQLERTQSRFEGLSTKLDAISSKMKDVGGKMTAGITLPVLAGAGLSVKAFSDLNETINKVDVSFGNSSATVKEWAQDSITSMGLARQSALDATALFGDMGTGMGQTQAEAAKMSMGLTQLGADMASFKNVSFERAQTALAGIYTGETEALKGLGIVMTEANLEAFAMSQGITKSTKDMTQAEKVQLRYNYVMSVTKNAQGDFARTSDGLANKTRMSGERMKELSAQIGEKLAPAMNKLLETGNKILDWFNGLSSGQQTVVLAIIGIVAAIGPLLLIIGNLITAIQGISAAFAFLSANPVVLAVVAIILLIAGLAYLIITNWDTLKQWFANFWNWLMGIVNTVINFIKNNWEMLLPILMGPLGLLIVFIVKNFDTIKAVFLSVVNAIVAGAQAVWGFLTGVFNGIKNTIVSVFQGAASIVSNVWNGIKNFFSGLGSSIGGAIGGVTNTLTAPFKSAFNAIAGFWNNTIGKLSFTAPDWVPGIGGKGFTMPKLPTLYTGVRNFSGGPAIVGDVFGRGGEIVSLPRGTDVFSNSESRNILRNLAENQGGGGGMTFNNYGSITNETPEASKAFWDKFNRMSELASQGVPTNG